MFKQKTNHNGDSVYTVPTFTDEGLSYIVDMDMVVTDQNKRKEYCYMELGDTFTDKYFEGFHGQVTNDSEIPIAEDQCDNPGDNNVDTLNTSIDVRRNPIEEPIIRRGPADLWTPSECDQHLSSAHGLVKTRSHDQGFLKGIIKFCDRVKKYQNQSSK